LPVYHYFIIFNIFIHCPIIQKFFLPHLQPPMYMDVQRRGNYFFVPVPSSISACADSLNAERPV
jgi:hypothetical protein